MKLIDWFKQIGTHKNADMELTDETCVELLRYLENCEMGCEDVFDALDQYAETELRKEDAAHLMPLVHDHLESCSECCDAYEALLDVLVKAREKPET